MTAAATSGPSTVRTISSPSSEASLKVSTKWSSLIRADNTPDDRVRAVFRVNQQDYLSVDADGQGVTLTAPRGTSVQAEGVNGHITYTFRPHALSLNNVAARANEVALPLRSKL